MRARFLVFGLFSVILLTSGGAFAHGKKNQGNGANDPGSQGDQGSTGQRRTPARTPQSHCDTACIADLGVNFGEASAKCLNMTDASRQEGLLRRRSARSG